MAQRHSPSDRVHKATILELIGLRRRSVGESGATIAPSSATVMHAAASSLHHACSPSLDTRNLHGKARRASLRSSKLSRLDLEEEDLKSRSGSSWVLHPYSEFRFYWDIVLLFFMAYSSIVLPLQFADIIDDSLEVLTIDQVTNLVFVLDMIFNFRTGYVDVKQRTVVLEPRAMARWYMSTYFLPDGLATIPWDLVYLGCGVACSSDEGVSWLFKWLRVIRMIRLLRLTRIFGRLQVRVGLKQTFSTAIFFGVGGLLMAHLSACFWYTIGVNARPGTVGWVERYDPHGEWGLGDVRLAKKTLPEASSSHHRCQFTFRVSRSLNVGLCRITVLELHDHVDDRVRRHHRRLDVRALV